MQSLFGQVFSRNIVLSGEKFNCYKSLGDGTTKVGPGTQGLQMLNSDKGLENPYFVSIDSKTPVIIF